VQGRIELGLVVADWITTAPTPRSPISSGQPIDSIAIAISP
jgi:hypothetical protein